MSIWDQKNAEVGAQPVRTAAPSGNQSGAWARANASVVSGRQQYTSPVDTSRIEQKRIEDSIMITRPDGSTTPFLAGATISAPAPSNKPISLEGVTINRPSTGLPLLEVNNPRITTGESATFVQRGIAAAGNALLGAFTGITKSLGDLFDVQLATPANEQQKAAYEEQIAKGNVTNPAIAQRLKEGKPAFPTTAERVGSVISVGAAGAGGAFAPVSAELAAAEQLPIIGKPVFGTINKGFELLDHASRFVGSKVVDLLPVDDQSKAVLRQPIEDLAGIVGTLFLVKGIHAVAETGGGRAVDVLPVSERAKANIKTGVSNTASFAMQPFSSAYRGIVASIESKVAARQAAGEVVDAEVAKVIVNQAVKENPMPETPAVMEIPVREGKTENLYTNQKLVLQSLIRGREDLSYRVVKDLGVSMNTGKPITSRFEWDYKNQRGTVYVTDKAQAVDLAHELGYYVDRRVGASLSKRLSDVLPEYRTKRDEVNQMLADYALDRLGGDATHAEISAEVLKIADNIRAEVEANTGRALEKAKAKDFATTFGDVLDNPNARAASPELAQLADFALGNVARKGKADVTGAPGTAEEAKSVLETLNKTKKEQIREVKQSLSFQEQRLKDQMALQAVNERGDLASANFNWKDIVKGIRDSKEFKKQGSVTDATINGVIMVKDGKYRLVPHSDVRAMQRNGWESRFTMDEIAHANGFESAEEYTFYIMELDTSLRAINRSSEQRAAHEFLMKNDPNYAKLNETIDTLREQLTGAEDAVPRQEQASAGNAGRVPSETKAVQNKPTGEVTLETKPTPEPKPVSSEVPRGTSKVAESIARKTIEQKLEDSYGDVAGYEKINIKDQARRMDELINGDLERAKRIMTGQEALPDGLRAGAVIKAMEEYALKTGDAELAFELANSPLVAETSVHAQEMRLLAERTPDSVTSQLRSVKRAREETAKEALRHGQTLFDATKKAKSELQDAVKKSRPTKESWSNFIDSIKCA